MLTLPYKAGVIMVAYSKDRFKYQNWIDTYPDHGSAAAAKKGGAIRAKQRTTQAAPYWCKAARSGAAYA